MKKKEFIGKVNVKQKQICQTAAAKGEKKQKYQTIIKEGENYLSTAEELLEMVDKNMSSSKTQTISVLSVTTHHRLHPSRAPTRVRQTIVRNVSTLLAWNMSSAFFYEKEKLPLGKKTVKRKEKIK
ncbi:hypothetical protein TNCV_3770551 [Trichonephila clavipes]|nr:hypothetical protein TNCV_3770551 [Trichonephila clavipes]